MANRRMRRSKRHVESKPGFISDAEYAKTKTLRKIAQASRKANR
jgi:hypothetical protein